MKLADYNDNHRILYEIEDGSDRTNNSRVTMYVPLIVKMAIIDLVNSIGPSFFC